MNTKKTAGEAKNHMHLFGVLLLLGLFFLYYPYIQNYSTTPKWIFLGIFGLGLAFFGSKKRLSWSLGLTLWALFVIQYLIQCNWSYNFWDSLIRSTPLILAPIIALLLKKQSRDIRELWSVIGTIAMFLILPLLLYTLLQILGLYLGGEYTHQSTYDFRFTFGHRNQFVQLLALLIPVLVMARMYAQHRWKKHLFVTTIVLIYITAVLLMNRTVFIVLFGIYPLGAIVLFAVKQSKRFRRNLYLIGLVGFIAGGAIIFSPIGKKLPVVNDLLATSYGSGNERVRIWKNSVDLWKEDFFIGKGSGDWKIEILRTDLIHTKADQGQVFYQRAHNDFLQVAVENGLLGVVLLLAFFVVISIQLLRSDAERNIKVVSLFGILGFVVIANFSFPLEKVELLLLLFLFSSPGFREHSGEEKYRKLELSGVFALVSLVTIMASIWFKNERLYFDYKSGIDRDAFAQIDKTFYTIDPTSTPLYWNVGNESYEQGNFNDALPNYEKALQYNPYHVHALNNLGSCFYSLGEIDYAEEQYEKVLEINPRFVETLMNYASLHFNRNDIDGALNTILKVPIDQEPENYRLFITTIAQDKFKWLIELYDEPGFENFMIENYNNPELMYQISVNSRNSWASYEDEMRIYYEKNVKNL